MAWIFSLSAECGSDESTAHKLAQHFMGQILILSNGSSCLFQVDTFQDIESNWWCRVYPNNISEVGINSPESAYLMTDLGILLYQKLRTAPAFRYALVGVEVDEFRTYSELIEDLPNLSVPGLVLSQIIEREVEILPIFRQFSFGYIWQPYQGEIYNPLMVSPELKTKLDELLVIS
ncbi:hypothetical protein [Nostoc cycadae]|uniref:Uncharacterized protein n=1 Tax=Nostoc cycadae WK-1 TaxID=1861711 RepID=A0A2H6LGM0_9NOSO|nr:hypothetical protein [Nostoc cycadae]GBE92367.1 hypothetical protein NCWK1_2122 [Nostoc cycadae WK-1]